MFSHWSRRQLGLVPHAVQEVVHRKQNLATRGCVIDCVSLDQIDKDDHKFGPPPIGGSPNGGSPNGSSPNGVSPNGVSPNGVSLNGGSPNRVSPYGL